MLVASLALSAFTLSACATMAPQYYQSAWQPIVKMNEPKPSSSVDSKTYMERLQAYRSKHQNDMNQCRASAVQAASQAQQSSVLGGAVLGTVGGAIAGTVIGAATGNPGKGAAIGAASGGVLGAGHGIWESGKEQRSKEWQFQNTFARCMQHEGWHILNPPKQ
jgi:outer membrane lipoprotein SlyB